MYLRAKITTMIETFLTKMNDCYDDLEKLLLEQPKNLPKPLSWLWNNTENMNKYILFITNPLGKHYTFESDKDLDDAWKATLKKHTDFMNSFYDYFHA